jgi:hypothetical protein
MKYDDATWHSGGDFPKDLPAEAGATHIGMFVSWGVSDAVGNAQRCQESANAVALRQVTQDVLNRYRGRGERAGALSIAVRMAANRSSNSARRSGL